MKNFTRTLGVICGLLLGLQTLVQAQDFNMTQYHYTPLLTNPARAAASDDRQIFLNYRNQPNIADENYSFFMVTGIYPLINKNTQKRWGGVALSFLNDQNGTFLHTNGFTGAFAYNHQLGTHFLGKKTDKHYRKNWGKHHISFGAQGGYFQRSIRFDNLTTDAQFQGGIVNPNAGLGESMANTSQSYFAASAGMMWQAEDTLGNTKAFLGLSLYNINEPNQSFYNEVKDVIRRKFTMTGGMRVWENRNFSVFPNFRWINRTGNDQINAGAWVFASPFILGQVTPYFKDAKIGLGAWYNLNKAIVASLEFHKPSYFVAFNFDWPTAQSSTLWQGHSVFEITVGFKFKRKPLKKPHYDILPEKPDSGLKFNPEPPAPIQMAMVKAPPPLRETPKTKPGLEDGAFRFKLGSDKLDAKSEALLDSVAQKMIEFPESIIEVSGHTCNIGSRAGNLRLSKKRAAAVRKYLMEYDGIDPKRIKTAGYADKRPLVPNTNEPNRKKNRRVAFKMKFPDKE